MRFSEGKRTEGETNIIWIMRKKWLAPCLHWSNAACMHALALFLGNAEEKNKAKEMLSELQQYVQEDERKREINQISWLLKTKESAPKAFPRLERVEDILTMKLSSMHAWFTSYVIWLPIPTSSQRTFLIPKSSIHPSC